MKSEYSLALLIVLLLILIYTITSGRSDILIATVGGIAILASLSYFSFKQTKTGRGITDDNDGIIKLSDGLFVAKLANKPFYAIAEKLAINNYGFWSDTANLWEIKSMRDTITGVGMFRKSIQDYKNNMSNKLAGETWIAYITPRDPLVSLQQDSSKMVDEMVIAVTVKTGENSSVTSHMGVQKGIKYRRGFAVDKSDPVTSTLINAAHGISMQMHSFASKVMLKLNSDRKYQINSPVGGMLEIFLLKTPKEYIHYGTTTSQKRRQGEIYAIDNNLSDLEELRRKYPEVAKIFETDISGLIDSEFVDSEESAKKQVMLSYQQKYNINKKHNEYPSIINYSYDPFHMDVGDVFNSDREEDSWIKYHPSLYPDYNNDWIAIDIQPLAKMARLDLSYHIL